MTLPGPQASATMISMIVEVLWLYRPWNKKFNDRQQKCCKVRIGQNFNDRGNPHELSRWLGAAIGCDVDIPKRALVIINRP